MKIQKRALSVCYFLLTILLFNFSIGFAAALTNDNSFVISELDEKITFDDSDNDKIEDNFEELNRRKIEVDIFENEATIQSISVGTETRDLIRTDIGYGEHGVEIQIKYKSNLEMDFEITFGIVFRELIEFIDIDFNGIFDPEVDQKIQNYTLKDFSPMSYEKVVIQEEIFLHHLRIQNINKNFTLNLYFAEEFTNVENSLITPTQARIDIEIRNFNYLNDSSQIALYTSLESEMDFQAQHDTEDEENGYAKNERGVATVLNEYTGFFSWNEKGFVNENSQTILVSEILPDHCVENGNMVYLNYPRGENIYHSSKIGIEGLLITEEFPMLGLIILLIAIGAVSSIVGYSVYHQKKSKPKVKAERRYSDKHRTLTSQRHEPVVLFDSKLALQLLEEEDAIRNLYDKGDINITVISNDFYETIDNFGFKGNEKSEFIKEMLNLRPFEREVILREMLIKSQ